MEPPVNTLRVALHPDGMAPRILNLGQYRAHLLDRLRREVALTADERARGAARRAQRLSGARGLRRRRRTPRSRCRCACAPAVGELSFFSTIATFGTALDITLAELAIEAFFPADAETAAYLRVV